MTLSRLINKTPLTNEKCNVYEIDNVDTNLVNQILQSQICRRRGILYRATIYA
jgi:hypothetical protein